LARMRANALDPAPAQQRLLERLLAAGRRTAFGREHGFDRITTYEAYRSSVPLGDYFRMEPWWRRARAGETSVAWPGKVGYFGVSSGTTSGEKYLPISSATIGTNKRGGFDNLAPFLAEGGGDVLGGKFVFLGASTSLKREGPVWVGDNTGIMARKIPWPFSRLYLPGREIAGISGWEAKMAKVVECSIDADVRLIAGLPSWIVVFGQTLLEHAARAGRKAASLKDVWPNLQLIVHGGTSFPPYRERLRALLGADLWTLDGYSATEGGMLAVQDGPRDPSLIPLVDLGAFLEFVPLAEVGRADARRFRVHETEPGQDYAVVLTTNAGIWSYYVGDVVRFTSARPWRLAFAGRIAHMLNGFGEHVSGAEIEKALLEASRSTGVRVREHTSAARYPSPETPTGRHVHYVEFDGPPGDLARLAQVLDATIRAGNGDYDAHRAERYGMDVPLIVPVPEGTFLAWMKARGKLGGQNKIPRVLKPEQEVEIRALVESPPTAS
jgi:hypothetical protein